MIYSDYLRNEMQSTKWDRVRIDYSLVEQIIKAKEALLYQENEKSKIKVKTVNENKS